MLLQLFLTPKVAHMAISQPTPGDMTTRAEMKRIFGGGDQGGIAPSATTPNVLIYTDPKTGEQSGYFDGWLPEEADRGPLFVYTGHGQDEQTFVGSKGNGNRAILHHVDDGRALHVFKAVGTVPGSGTKQQRYIGEFELDAKQPYVLHYLPNRAGVPRRVIMFRLRPSGPYERRPKDVTPAASKTEAVTVPADVTESKIVEPETSRKTQSSRSAVPQTTVQRREARLSDDFQAFLESKQHHVRRFQINVKGLSSPLRTDLYDLTAHVLYEIKGTTSRESVRMAIGELLDYCRHVTPVDPVLAVLLPVKPHNDLRELLATTDIALVYREGETFIGWPVKA